MDERAEKDCASLDPLRLVAQLSSPNYHPPVLPAVALELVALSRKPTVGMRDIAALLERDPVLAADMLRIAQSAALRGASPIRSIDEALVRLGLRRASELFFRAALEAKLFRCGRAEAVFERLRKHSIATAELSRLVCRQTSLFDESAYLCGLLHDVGIAGCMLAICTPRQSNAILTFEQMWPVIAAAHVKFALHLVTVWNLPDEIRLVLSHHLTYGMTNPAHPLAAVTYLAECMAASLGVGFANENRGQHIGAAMRQLQINDVQLTQLEQVAKQSLEHLA
jgi:HD-like signal output (HDOD) protein